MVCVYDFVKVLAFLDTQSKMRLIRDVGHEAHKVLTDEGKGCFISENSTTSYGLRVKLVHEFPSKK